MQLTMRILSAIFCVFVFIQTGFAQSGDLPDGWKIFEKVKFRPKLMDDGENYLLAPKFNDKIRVYEGKEVALKGFVMPFEYGDEHFIILSKYPYTSCFFCGAAGPESVAEVRFTKKPPRFSPDQQVVIVGKLRLNSKDIEHMNFILDGSKIIREWSLK